MRGVDKLHPELQKCVEKFLKECEKQGLNVLITETLRTQKEQEALYAQGRTSPGKIVTNCRGYQSPHCWGVAFDFCRNKKGWEYDNTDGFFNKVGRIAEKLLDNTEYDLFWGGDFKTFVDRPHVEMKKYLPNNSTKTLINKYGTPEKFMETWKVEEEEEMVRYKSIDEVPEWGRNVVNKLIKNGFIAGTGNSLDLSEDLVRELVINDKTGMYDIFNKLEDMPDWAKPTIEKMLEKKILVGDKSNNLNLNMYMIRTFVTNDVAGLYN